MNRYEFFQKILAQLNEIQATLNTLRETIKEEIQNDAQCMPKTTEEKR